MKNKTSAFTLIELSAIIIIIGILIAGVMTATGLVKKSKIAAAQSLTKASPIAGINDNALWLESSSESSFKETESSTGDAVTTWYDQKIAANKSSVVAVGTGPTYSNTINYIHAVKFSGSTNNYLKIVDASFLNNTDYTIVVLEKRQAASAGNFLSTTDTSDAVDNKLAIGYASDGVINHSHNSTSYAVAPKVSAYANSNETPRLFVFTQSSTEGQKTYINGTLAAQDTSKTALLSGVTTLAIGKGYTGEIGEIAIFTRALKIEERKSTEDYLGKKWTRKLNRSAVSNGITGGGRDASGNPNCLNGTVTDSSGSGCENPCAVNVTGVSTPSSVVDGATGNLTCNTSLGYSGTIAYNCYGGDLHPSPSACNAITCTAAAGTGYAAQTGLAFATSGSGSFSCDTASYTGTKSYTCTTTGAATITGGTCTLLAPSNSVAPTLSTTSAVVGTAISVSSTGTWSPTPTSYTYAWWRSDGTPVAISGATSSSYTPVVADTGRTLICKVTAINSTGPSASPASSNATLAVSNPPVNSVAPALSSTSPSVGDPITVTTGTWSPTPTSYTYAWWRSDGTPVAISGATSSSYTPVTADAGRTLICKVTAIGSNGTSLAVSSNTSSAVAAFAQCTGGTITTVAGLTIHKFTSSGSLICAGATRTVNIFVVGAGGSGGTHRDEYSGGGGGGGIVKVTGFSLPSGTYTVTVGVGGGIGFTSGCGSKGANGGDSVFKNSSNTINVTAYGGGGGGGCNYGIGVYGGSGGGDTCGNTTYYTVGIPGTLATKGTTSGIASATITLYGNSGGFSNTGCSYGNGSGGGGAGGVGGNSSSATGGSGGLGLTDNISGSSVMYSAGGGGAGSVTGGAAGGPGAGAGASGDNAGNSGSANTGGGGGAGGGDGRDVKGGGDGGSGVVIVTYSNF